VWTTHHNITPAVDKQLVLGLKLRICSAELVDRLPGGLDCWQAGPMHQDVPNIAVQLGAFDAVWCFQQVVVAASWREVDRERA
jgi:hypothetical protein